MKVQLIEMETGVRIRDWLDLSTRCDSTTVFCDSVDIDCSDGADRFQRTLDPSMVYIGKVLQDGVELIEIAPDLFDATAGSWYVDGDVLHVHSLDGATPTTAAFVVVIIATYARGRTVVKARSTGDPLVWEGRVSGLPNLSQAIASTEPGAGSVAVLGELALNNEDGHFDRLLGERIVSGLEIRVLEGDDAASYDSFTVVRRAIMQEPVADTDRVRVPLFSLAATLTQPILGDEFTANDYPDMDPNITGFNIPVVLGTVVNAEAFRIASGRWKWSAHPTTSISAVIKADGTAVTVLTEDHALGEFTVSDTHDAEIRLFVSGRGVDLDYPGAWIGWIVQNLGSLLAPTSINAGALAALDDERPAKWGKQLVGSAGSVAETLDDIARSAFIDWLVDGRQNVLSARARRRDQGNYLDANTSTLEGGLGSWVGGDGASVSITNALAFRGNAGLQIIKSASSPTAHGRAASLNLKASTLYVVTCVAALVSGASTMARIAIADGAGVEYISEPYTLSSSRWTRMTLTVAVPLTTGVFFCDSTTVFCDSTTITCAAEAGEIRIYPQYTGPDDVTIVVDDIELVEAVVLDDINTEGISIAPNDPTLWRFRAGYQFDGLTQTRRFESRQDGELKQAVENGLLSTVSSREMPGHLVDSADASIVADAALDYYRSGRVTVGLRVLDLALGSQLTVGGDKVVVLNTTRRPSVPGDGNLFRVTSINEERPEEGGSAIAIEAEALFDPINDIETIITA